MTYYPTKCSRQQICDKCMSKEELFKCKGCLTMQYCSVACQEADAVSHKESCNRIKVFKGVKCEG